MLAKGAPENWLLIALYGNSNTVASKIFLFSVIGIVIGHIYDRYSFSYWLGAEQAKTFA